MKWNLSKIVYALVSVCLISYAATSTKAQSTPRDVVLQSNRQELDNLLLRKPILAADDRAQRQAALQQVNDDFKALQTLNNKVMSEVTREGEINYKSVSGWLSEMGSKASRLKTSIVLPNVKVEKRKSAGAKTTEIEFRDELMAFDKVVVGFATNPIFQKTNVIEVELAKKASQDLEIIIGESSRLKKVAGTMVRK